MTKFDDHPTVKFLRAQPIANPDDQERPTLDPKWLRKLCLDLGDDDVGFVSIDQPEIDDQRQDILKVFPTTKSLIAFVCKMNRDNVRNPARSIATPIISFVRVTRRTDFIQRA
jgi:hypothetical protein